MRVSGIKSYSLGSGRLSKKVALFAAIQNNREKLLFQVCGVNEHNFRILCTADL